MKSIDEDYMQAHEKVTRVEVCDSTGRAYICYGAKDVVTSVQDEGRTLKVFLNSPKASITEYEFCSEYIPDPKRADQVFRSAWKSYGQARDDAVYGIDEHGGITRMIQRRKPGREEYVTDAGFKGYSG